MKTRTKKKKKPAIFSDSTRGSDVESNRKLTQEEKGNLLEVNIEWKKSREDGDKESLSVTPNAEFGRRLSASHSIVSDLICSEITASC